VERQTWQDAAVRASVSKTDPQARPWMIFTCGAFGSGKGHVLSWLSGQGLFPLEYIVHVDPDFFKRVMPEWKGYLSRNQDFAGTATHPESIFMQEIAAEAALQQRQHVWIDGSLRNYEYYSDFIKSIKKRYRHYRIAILHIFASDDIVRARIQQRGEETGRFIPEAEIVKSLTSPNISVGHLAPLCDLVVRFKNDEGTPRLLSVEDHSGNVHRGLNRHFGVITRQHLQFPEGLGPLFFESTALGKAGHNPFLKDQASRDAKFKTTYPELSGEVLVKESKASPWCLCTARLADRVITCTPVHRPFGRPLALYEITDRTVVRLHEEFHHCKPENKSDTFDNSNTTTTTTISNTDTSNCTKETVPEEKIHIGDHRLRYPFYVNRLDENNNLSFLEFSCDDEALRESWKNIIIDSKVLYKKERQVRIYGDDTRRITKWIIDPEGIAESRSVGTLIGAAQAAGGGIKLKSSALCDRKATSDQQLSSVPEGAAHFRWFHSNFGE
jgi:hypothetical protein